MKLHLLSPWLNNRLNCLPKSRRISLAGICQAETGWVLTFPFDSCDFSSSDINSCHIQSSNLLNNLFRECSLKETEFLGSYIMGCDFSGADCTGATFKSGGFQNNPLTNAVWNRTSFIDSQIVDIVFEGTLEDCYFENCTFTKVAFQNSTLINTFFKNKSLKRIRFIDCQADRMTYAFLKNGKADLSGITLLTT